MAKSYHEFGALKQKIYYLDHAMNLSILLADEEIFRDEARCYIHQICALKNLVTPTHSQDDPPETPKRNAETSSFPSSTDTFPDVETSKSVPTEPIESDKKMSDSSTFSCSLKERYSSISNRASAPLPDSSASSSLNNSPQMKKKSNPPIFKGSLKDRYPTPDLESSSLSLPIEEKRKESDVTDQVISSVRASIIHLNKKTEELEEEKKRNLRKNVNEERKREESEESKVVSFTDEYEDGESLHDTYI